MVAWAGWVLAAGSLGGLALVAMLQGERRRLRWPGWAHGLVGVVGFGLLVAGLRAEPVRGVAEGAGSFGVVAGWLLGGALALGSWVFLGRVRRRRPSNLVLGVHASLAVGGMVMLTAYLS